MDVFVMSFINLHDILKKIIQMQKRCLRSFSDKNSCGNMKDCRCRSLNAFGSNENKYWMTERRTKLK